MGDSSIRVNYNGLVYVYKDFQSLRRAVAEDVSYNQMVEHASVVVDPATKTVLKSRDHNVTNLNIALSYPVEDLNYYRDLLK